jgi:hypothetical protein
VEFGWAFGFKLRDCFADSAGINCGHTLEDGWLMCESCLEIGMEPA